MKLTKLLIITLGIGLGISHAADAAPATETPEDSSSPAITREAADVTSAFKGAQSSETTMSYLTRMAAAQPEQVAALSPTEMDEITGGLNFNDPLFRAAVFGPLQQNALIARLAPSLLSRAQANQNAQIALLVLLASNASPSYLNAAAAQFSQRFSTCLPICQNLLSPGYRGYPSYTAYRLVQTLGGIYLRPLPVR